MNKTLPLANWKKVCNAIPVAIAIADRLVHNLGGLTPGGMDYRRKLTQQNTGCKTQEGGLAPKPSPIASCRLFLDKASMHHCVHTPAWLVFKPVVLAYFLTGGNMHIIDAVKRDLDHPQLAITGVVATFFDGRTKLSQEILENVREYFRDVVFQTVIRKNVKIDEAQSHQQSVITYAPQSTGALEYGSLVEEVIQRETTGTRRKSTRKTT
jgi:hypothetical protein